MRMRWREKRAEVLKAKVLLLFIFLGAFLSGVSASADPDGRPNIVLIFADDLGYGDIGQYGADFIETPNIDSLAVDGVKLTSFYASANVCTPSRASLLTGRYAIRTGLANKTIAVGSSKGMPQREVTLAEQLQQLGYQTALIGKWHLGSQSKHWPTKHGFDQFYGILHSNDVPDQALYRNDDVVNYPIRPDRLTLDFTREALRFIEQSKDAPFFLFMSMTSPHKPLLPSKAFIGKSDAGLYGDVVEELDWGVGEVLAQLRHLQLDRNTLVIFTSDNGPFPEGSAGGLRGGKGTGWDGGYRVPLLARWIDKIPKGAVSDAITMNIDLFPTIMALAGGTPSKAPKLDGKNIFSVLEGGEKSPHEVLYFFNNERIAALRTQRWRLMLSDYPPWRDARPINFEGRKNLYTLMYDMSLPPAQQYDVSRDNAQAKQALLSHLAKGRESLESLSTLPDSEFYANSHKN